MEQIGNVSVTETISLSLPKRFSAKEAAPKVGLCERTLLKYAREQRISHFCVGGRISFSAEQLENFIRESECVRQVA